jgi:predicted outer membrane repeat protein
MPKNGSSGVKAVVAETINLTDVLTLIIREIVKFSPVFSHIDTDRLLVSVSSNRSGGRGGAILGKLVPLRFESGLKTMRYRGRLFTMPEVRHRGIPQLYIVYFYMPRFFDLPAEEKLRVIFHELYHINPEFNGDIRRMGKKKAAHGHSKKHFDFHFIGEAEAFCASIRETGYYRFLSLSTKELEETFCRITSLRIKTPRPVAVKGIFS